jgi:hypothetical protein
MTKAKPPTPPYDPTPEETAVLRRLAKHRAAAPEITMRQTEDGPSLIVKHPSQPVGRAMLLNALGARDPEFLAPFLTQIVNVTSKGGEVDEAATNFMLATIKDLEPRDTTEAMLAAQMAAVHMAALRMARQLAAAEMIPQQDAAERAFNKLARTFAAQMDTLKRYRSKGEQKVTVQHVTVNDGGQAVVGDVRAGGRGDGKA